MTLPRKIPGIRRYYDPGRQGREDALHRWLAQRRGEETNEQRTAEPRRRE